MVNISTLLLLKSLIVLMEMMTRASIWFLLIILVMVSRESTVSNQDQLRRFWRSRLKPWFHFQSSVGEFKVPSNSREVAACSTLIISTWCSCFPAVLHRGREPEDETCRFYQLDSSHSSWNNSTDHGIIDSWKMGCLDLIRSADSTDWDLGRKCLSELRRAELL